MSTFTDTPLHAASLQTRSARLPNGLRLEYAEQGARGGTTVLLLHGSTDSWRSFEPLMPWLPKDWHVIALSQRGHGGSDSSAHSDRTPDFAADAAALVRQLGLPPVLAEAFQQDTASGPLPPGLLDTMVDECLKTPAPVWRAAFAGLFEDSFRAGLERIAVPTLLVWGDADAFVPRADQDRHCEQPERVAAELVRFALTLPARQTTFSNHSSD